MKKVISFLIAIIILGSSCVCFAYEENEEVEFVPLITTILTNKLDDPIDWDENDASRALFAFSILGDSQIQDSDLSDIFPLFGLYGDKTAYFIRFGAGKMSSYGLAYSYEDNIITLVYNPNEGTATYYVLPETPKLALQMVLEDYRTWELDEDALDDAFDVYMEIVEIILEAIEDK